MTTLTKDEILAAAQRCGVAHNSGAGGEYLLCATEAQLIAFGAALNDSFMERTGQYVTNDASREAAVQGAIESYQKTCADLNTKIYDEVFVALELDPEQFRTEGGAIKIGRLRAAIRYPNEYLPAGHWLRAGAAVLKDPLFGWEIVDGKQHDTGRVTRKPVGGFVASTACPEDAALIADALNAHAALAAPAAAPFQHRVQPWLLACFGAEIAADKIERNHRFLEEALELVQACGCTASEAHQLVDYVFGRPLGEPAQEVGGVMVTLAALCLAQGLDMHQAGETELTRIWSKVEAIRAKQAAKPKHSPLPVVPAPAPAPEQSGGAHASNGWYCAHCQRGVDASEVTYHEQHTVCGRVITDDMPPAKAPATAPGTAWHLVLAPNGLEGVAFSDTADARYAATGKRGGGTFGVSSIAEAFRDAYDEADNFEIVEVRAASQAPAVVAQERDRLRAAQAAAVMPLIGPLLDAWQNADHDALEDQAELVKQMEAINFAMEHAGDESDMPVQTTQPAAEPADAPPWRRARIANALADHFGRLYNGDGTYTFDAFDTNDIEAATGAVLAALEGRTT